MKPDLDEPEEAVLSLKEAKSVLEDKTDRRGSTSPVRSQSLVVDVHKNQPRYKLVSCVKV